MNSHRVRSFHLLLAFLTVALGAVLPMRAATLVCTNTGNWADPLTWSPNQSPGAADVVTIGNSFTVTITNVSTVAGLTLNSSGTLTGSGDVTVTGVLNWSSGTMSGSGRTIVANTGTLNLDTTTHQLNRILQNNGTAAWTVGALQLNGGAFLNNGSFTANGGASALNCYGTGGVNTFANAGTFTKQGAGATSFFVSSTAVTFTNSGTVEVQGGTLVLSAGGDNSGAIVLAAGTALGLSGNFSHAATSAINGSGTFNVTGGNHTFAAGAQLGVSQLNLSSGTVGFAGAIGLTNVNFTSGTLTGSGDVTVTGTLQWSGGTMSGSGRTLIPSGATLSLDTTTHQLDRVLQNDGTTTWTVGALQLNGGAFLNNGSFTANGGASALNCYGTGGVNAFANVGTFTKQGAGTAQFYVSSTAVAFNNSGAVDVQAGTLLFNAGGTNSGSIQVATGTALGLSGNHTHAATSTISGAGTVSITGGSHTFLAGAQLGATQLNLSGSTVDFAGAINLTNLNFGSGTLTGSGNVTVSGALIWSSGTMNGAGRTIVANTGTLSLDTSTHQLDRVLENNGAATWTVGALQMNGGIFTNRGSFTASSSATLSCYGTGGINTFANAGTFTKQGAGPLQYFVSSTGVSFNNSGAVVVSTGTLTLDAGGAHSNDFTVASGATLRLSGTHSFTAAADITGAGSLLVAGGAITDAGSVNIGGATFSGGTASFNGSFSGGSSLTVSGGTVNFNGPTSFDVGAPVNLSAGAIGGSGDLTVTGPLTWSGGGMSGSGRTIIASGVTLTLNNTTHQLDRVLQNDGVATWTVGAFQMNGGTFINNGSFAVSSSTTLSCYGTGGANTFNNAGTFTQQGAGATQFFVSSTGVTFTNNGALAVSAGTLTFNSGFTQTSGQLLLSGGTVSANATMQIQGGGISGAGTINASVNSSGIISPGASPGLLSITGNYTQGTNGVLNIELAGPVAVTNFDQLTIGGAAALAGTLNVTFLNGFLPAANSSFTFLTAGSRSGSFGTFLYPSNSAGLQLTYSGTSATLQEATVPFTPTASWVGGSGNWLTESNWSTGTLPGPSDDVLINVPGDVIVTHSSGAHSVRSLYSQNALVLSGGSLTVTNTLQVNNGLTLTGGTLRGANVLPGSGGQGIIATGSGGTLDGVIVNGTLDVGRQNNGAGLTVINSLTLNGTLYVGNATNNWYGQVGFAGTQTLGGTGTVIFGNQGACNTLRLDTGGTTLTIGSNLLVRGHSGQIGQSTSCIGTPANVSVINQGIIAADVSGGTITTRGQSFVNAGMLVATNGGHLSVQNLTGDLGAVSLVAGSTLSLNGAYTNNLGLNLTTNSVLNLSGIWANTGSINATNATVNLGGSFTLAGLGGLNRSGGTVNLTGTLDANGGTLAFDAVTGLWVMSGGTFRNGVLSQPGADRLVFGSGTLDGATVNGDLDVGRQNNAASLAVLNGLTLNGTLYVGNPTNSWYGQVAFVGTQTLGGNGTVVFGNQGACNTLRLDTGGTTLTLGAGIAVRGHSGQIGQSTSCIGTPANVNVINQGSISADTSGGTINIRGSTFANQGLLEARNGGQLNIQDMSGNVGAVSLVAGSTLTLNGAYTNDLGLNLTTNAVLNLSGTWVNLGGIHATNATVNLGGSSVQVGTIGLPGSILNVVGSFTSAQLAAVQYSLGAVRIGSGGVVDNTAGTLDLDGSTGSWLMNGGTLRNGVLNESGGAQLVFGSGNLDGVTINGDVDVGRQNNGAGVTVLNGLTLNGTLYVGNPTNNWYGQVAFVGTQTLGGSGTVVFGNQGACNVLRLDTAGTTLTLGTNIVVRGHSGQIGQSTSCIGTPANVSVINQGSISADVSGGTINLRAQNFTNQALVQALSGAAVLIDTLQNTVTGSVLVTNGTLTLNGNWSNAGVINATNATVNLGGSSSLVGNFSALSSVLNVAGNFTTPQIQSIQYSPNAVRLNAGGLVNNTNTTLTLDAGTGSWLLNGGLLRSGIVSAAGGAQLNVGSGTLDGVTVDADLDVGRLNNGASLSVVNGLTLNGTLYVGNPTNSWYGQIGFVGSQTLAGAGTVVFGNQGACNALRVDTGGTTLTLGTNITVHGHSGQIGQSTSCIGSAANVTVVNLGLIGADVTGGTINIRALSFTNQGRVDAQKGTINLYGAYSLAGGTLSLGITGLTDYGRINFLNPVTMQGTFQAQFTGFYRPTTGSAFTLLTYPSSTGTFDVLDLPTDVLWQTTNSSTAFAITATALLELPSIAVGPQTQSVVVGSNATLSVSALGTQPLAYQWQLAGVNLVNSTHLGGVQSDGLTITNVVFGDAGGYRVVVTNNYGAITSSVATLTPVCIITASNNPPAAGAIAGTGLFPAGATHGVTATPNFGYAFANWTEGVTVLSTNSTYSTLLLTNHFFVANYQEINSSHVVITATSPLGLVAITGAGTYTNGQVATFAAPLILTNGPTRYVFKQYKLNGSALTNAPSFSKTFSTIDATNIAIVAEYDSQNLLPLVLVAAANIPNPVGATTNFILTLQFDRTLNSVIEPLVILTNSLTALPLTVSTGGVWTTTTLSNDTYVTPRTTLSSSVDGTNRVWVSQAQDLYGVAVTPTNVLSVSVDATFPIVSNVSVNPSALSAAVTWSTDENTISLVDYGLTSAYGQTVSSGSRVASHNLTLNGLSTATTYHYRVRSADAAGNTTSTADNTFTTLAAPDLLVVNLSVTGTLISGNPVTISWADTNSGSGATFTSWYDQVIVTNLTTGKQLLNTVQLYDATANGVIAPNGARSRQLNFVLPNGADGAGNLQITVIVDNYDYQYEANLAGSAQTNNTTTVNVLSTLGAYPDLQVTGLVVTNAQVRSGSTIGIVWQDANTGAGIVTNGFADRITIVNVTNSQTLLNTVLAFDPATAGNIAGGGSAARYYAFTLPDGPGGAGDFQITITADSQNDLYEFSAGSDAETNNTRAITATSALSPYPDLVVTNIIVPASAAAGSAIAISWTDRNQGNGAATNSWFDQVFLTDTNTLGGGQILGSFAYNAGLPAGQSMTITQTVTLPAFVTSNQWIIVKANAASAFYETSTANNSAIATNAILVAATLQLSVSPGTVSEAAGANAVLVSLTRNGVLTSPLPVTLTTTLGNLTLPPVAVIPAGASSTNFYVGVVDNLIAGDTATGTILAQAAGFAAAQAPLTITDNDTPALTITLSTNRVDENGPALTGTVTRNANFGSALTVSLGSDQLATLIVPASVVIPANAASVNFVVAPVADGILAGVRQAHVTATASGFNPVTVAVDVLDSDKVRLTLALRDAVVLEGAGNGATIGTVSRVDVTASAQTVQLTVVGSPLLAVPSQVTIPANAASATFNVNVGSDGLVTGNQSATITARSLNLSGIPEVNGVEVVTLQIVDTNSPTLTLMLPTGTIAKGSNTLVTVARNTPATNAFTAALTATPNTAVTLPASVNFALNQTSATFTVTGVLDGLQTGNKTVTLAATAGGFNSATALLTVSDIYLPDLIPTGIGVATNALTGQQVTVSWSIANQGLGDATNQVWYDYVYLAADNLAQSTTLVGASARPAALAVGESYTNQASFYLPEAPGRYWIMIVANGNNTLAEISTANNSALSALPMEVNPAYRATVTNVAPALAAAGTPIVITGRTFNPTSSAVEPNRALSVRILVNDTRRVFTTTSDANGNFAYTFQPLAKEAGDYLVSADHPNVATNLPQGAFVLLGMAALPETVSGQLLPGEPLRGQFVLSNLTSHALSGLTFSTPDLGTNLSVNFTFTNNALAANGTLVVDYKLETPLARSAQLNFNVTATAAEGAVVPIPFRLIVVPTLAQLSATPTFLGRGMVRGQQTVVALDIVNNGGGASGDLTVQLPAVPWLTLGSVTNIPSIPAGSNTTVTLVLNPPNDLTLGLYNGNIVVNNQNVGVTIPYQFRAVSDGRGDLRVTVTDDYTFYVAGEPKVTNATVVLRDPFTGSIVAQTNSGSTGIVEFAGLAEGSYTVDASANQHNQFRGTATITTGATNALEVFLPRQLVTYQWSVVPTEIADHYKVVLESVFETEVPVPNVIVEEPEVMLIVAPGEVSQFEIKLTNHGLIAAKDVKVSVPYNANYLVTPLVENVGIIPAKSTVTVPVTVQLRATAGQLRADGTRGRPIHKLDGGGCTLEDLNGCLPKIPLKVNYAYYCGGTSVNQSRSVDLSILCTANSVKECWDNLIGITGSANLTGVACNTLSAFLACVGGGLTPCQQAAISTACGAAVGFATGGFAGAGAGAASAGASGILACICSHLDDIPWPTLAHASAGNPSDVLGWLPLPGAGTLTSCSAPVVTFIEIPGGNCASPSPSMLSNPNSVKRTVPSLGGPRLSGAIKADASAGVCARVRIRINQDVVLTRSAFLGTLEIENGGSTDITGVRVTLDFRDGSGGSAVNKFVTEGPALSSLTGVDGTGVLAGGATGSAVYTFIPTLDAAPDRPFSYQIGGTLRYLDGGQEVIVPLLSAPLTVYPEARLNLVYFQQRDVYGDDPFTATVEPSEFYTMGLIVKNGGAGDAKNFQITSAQPQIIENEKGLLIDFSIVGTRVESNAVSPSLTARLGDIPAGATKEVTWQLLSSLQGKFISFSATFEHVDPLGRSNLSLINSVETHELIHAVLANRTEDDRIPDFLVNDYADADNLPDLLYLNNGGIAFVNAVTNGDFDGPVGPGHLQVQLASTVSDGWNYLRLPDPGAGYRLANVVRSDGKIIELTNNAWTTTRSFPSSSPGAIKENLLHLFDYAGSGSYTLYYGSTNTTPPAIVQLGPVTPFNQTGAVSNVTVTFSEAIDANTFTPAALTLTRDGGANLISGGSAVGLTLVSNYTYVITGLGSFTSADGNYQLTLDIGGIADLWGNSGSGSAGVAWAKGTVAPVVQSIAAITPNPRNVPVTSVVVTFSKAINAGTFDSADLTLTRNGGGNLITSGVTVAPLSATTFAVNGLGNLTGSEGNYVLTVNATAVQDPSAVSGFGAQAATWSMVTTGPRLSSLEPIATNPRNIVVQSLQVGFAAPIDPASFSYQDLTLTRDGGLNLITSEVTITALTPTNYVIGNISWVQGYAGNYLLAVAAGGISDLAGNTGTGSTNRVWEIILAGPASPTNVTFTPDTGFSATDGLTATNVVTFSGAVATTNLTVRLFDETASTELGTALVNGTNFTATVTFAAQGRHHVRFSAVDLADNVSSPAYRDVFVDVVPPAVTFAPVPSPSFVATSTLAVTFSEAINPGTLSAGNFTVTRDGTNDFTPSLTVVSSNVMQLGNLASYTTPLATYVVTYNPANVQDLAGNRSTNSVTLTWTRVTTNVPPLLTFITNRVVTPDGVAGFKIKAIDPNGDKLAYALTASTAAGAEVVATNGLFYWVPTRAMADTTNEFTISVTDDGNPPMSVSQSFSIVVLDYLELNVGSTNLQGGETVSTPIYLDSNDGVTNVQFSLQVPALDLTNWTLLATAPELGAASLQDQVTNLVIKLPTGPGQSLQGKQLVAYLGFTALTNRPSTFVALPVSEITGNKPNSNTYSNRFANTPLVAVVQDLPLLQGAVATNQTRSLALFGRVGTNYQLQFTTNFPDASGWLPVMNYSQTNGVIRQGVNNLPFIFYRLQQQ